MPGSGLVKGVWTLENYTRIVTDEYYREVIWRTLGLGLFVTLACLRARLSAGVPDRARAGALARAADPARHLPNDVEPRGALLRLDRACWPIAASSTTC